MKIVDLKRLTRDEVGTVLVLVPGSGATDGFWVKAQSLEPVVVEEIQPGLFQVDVSDREFWELNKPRHAIIIC